MEAEIGAGLGRIEWGDGVTHEVGRWPSNRLLADSAGRGWRNVHAALATVNSWSGTLTPKGHPCLAYCLNRPAWLQRKVPHAGGVETGTVRPRQFLVIPGHEATEWHRHGSSDMLMLYLRQDTIDAIAGECLSASRPSVALDLSLGAVDPLLEQIALTVLGILQTPEDGTSALYVDSLVRTLILHQLRRQTGLRDHDGGPAADTSAMRRVLDLIEASLDTDLAVPFLAREAQLAPQTFARAFSRKYGTTVHQYVLARRVQRAKDLLVSTDLPIVAVALQTGFASQSHLSTAFKRLTGVTPGGFRSATGANGTSKPSDG